MSIQHNTSHTEVQSSAKPYIVGFVLSLLFTIIPFYFLKSMAVEKTIIFAVILICASIQLFIQGWFFLHLNHEKKPFYYTQSGAFAIFGVLVLVLGSMWVMWQLNYHMMH